jgi:hypothetical protein
VTGAPDFQRGVESREELRAVRHQLGQLLAPIGNEDLSFRAALAADELLANFLAYTDEDCTIAAWLDHGPPLKLRVEVRDAGDEQAVMPTSRGLRVVDRVTSRWGVETRPGGKVVWFEIALPSPVDG